MCFAQTSLLCNTGTSSDRLSCRVLAINLSLMKVCSFPGLAIVPRSFSPMAQIGSADSLYTLFRRPFYTAQANPEQSLSFRVLNANLNVLVWGVGLLVPWHLWGNTWFTLFVHAPNYRDSHMAHTQRRRVQIKWLCLRTKLVLCRLEHAVMYDKHCY